MIGSPLQHVTLMVAQDMLGTVTITTILTLLDPL